MDETPGRHDAVGGAPSCVVALAGDLGWGLGVVLRAYVAAAHTAVADLPGGPRGYQILSAAAQGAVNSQLALAQHLGVDRTVMTYLIDDLHGPRRAAGPGPEPHHDGPARQPDHLRHDHQARPG